MRGLWRNVSLGSHTFWPLQQIKECASITPISLTSSVFGKAPIIRLADSMLYTGGGTPKYFSKKLLNNKSLRFGVFEALRALSTHNEILSTVINVGWSSHPNAWPQVYDWKNYFSIEYKKIKSSLRILQICNRTNNNFFILTAAKHKIP